MRVRYGTQSAGELFEDQCLGGMVAVEIANDRSVGVFIVKPPPLTCITHLRAKREMRYGLPSRDMPSCSSCCRHTPNLSSRSRTGVRALWRTMTPSSKLKTQSRIRLNLERVLWAVELPTQACTSHGLVEDGDGRKQELFQSQVAGNHLIRVIKLRDHRR